VAFTVARVEHRSFLMLLVAADLMFILLHVLHTYTRTVAGDPGFSLERDRGYAEVFQYVKLFWIALLLGAAFVKSRRVIYCSWALLFAYLLLDDSFQIHERFGYQAAMFFAYKPLLGLRPQDFGELTITAVVGGTFLLLLATGYLFTDQPQRMFSIALGGLLAVIALFGVGVDMLHSALAWSAIDSLLALLEDGGEMLAVSATCWFVFASLAGSKVPARDHQL
jgi:hypothetical protein